MTYREAEKLTLETEWKTSFCNEGEDCWCRVIEPKEEIIDEDGNELFIAHSGSISKDHAEHIVNLHNNWILNRNNSGNG